MFQYLEEYAKEWRSGKLFGKAKQRGGAPWHVARRQESAYELSQTKYAEYKETIAFLVESYMKDKKKFIRYHTLEELRSDTDSNNERLIQA